MIMTKHDKAKRRTASVSLQLTLGSHSEGTPPWTGPLTQKPCCEKGLSHVLAAIAPTTNTMSETGNFGANFLLEQDAG